MAMCGGGGEQRSLLARRLNNRRAWIVRSTAETTILMAVVVSVFARLMGGRRARALLGVREAATALTVRPIQSACDATNFVCFAKFRDIARRSHPCRQPKRG